MKYFFGLLTLLVALVWLAVFSLPDGNLHLIACDVGEGDAILATYGAVQILTDGGPDRRVLDCLGRHLPFWDKQIEAVILTHPDKDHYGGLVEVLRRYQVDNFFHNGQDSGSSGYQVLKNLAGSQRVLAAGAKIRAGKIQLDVLHPPGESSSHPAGGWASEDNALSIVSLLHFGRFKALLTGDIPTEVSDRLVSGQPIGPLEYIKVPHHGSKNGLTESLLAAIRPKAAVISVGKNSYGHPAGEILKILSEKDIKILRTDEVGDVEVVSNGKSYWISR